ncbi:MAG: TIGR00282 family metallophosphoesterase [Chloroflexota bacterium]|nr:TIGR00282 family metallophosphoesterase [Chloroflexota bacterium]MDE3192682.1 TIGR00282 family metallophosphoesterase [Chloroflexota bacterium]
MRILFVGDVVGRPGREAVKALLPRLREELRVELVVLNGENAAGGAGLTAEIARELRDAGADVLTNGNHVWDQRVFLTEIETLDYAIRPLNLPPRNPGRGWTVVGDVLVVNAIGRVFMAAYDDPFRAVDALLAELGERAPRVRILDWHAEATSEKNAMGWHLDGRFSAVVGSHTHIPTADARVLPAGTAFVSDTGMVGPRDSVLGVDPKIVVDRFITGIPKRFEVAKDGPVVFNSVLIDVDGSTGRARSIERVDRTWERAA